MMIVSWLLPILWQGQRGRFANLPNQPCKLAKKIKVAEQKWHCTFLCAEHFCFHEQHFFSCVNHLLLCYGVPEKKIFLRFLPYMGMVASLVMWPGAFEQTFVTLSEGGFMWNLASVGPVLSEEKMFENVDTHTHTHMNNRGLPIP